MKTNTKTSSDTAPFATLPQSILYSEALDALDIRLILHFEGTYRLKGEVDVFEYSVPALHALFPQYGRQMYRRKVKKYTDAGVLTFTRFKVIRGKRMPLYKYHPNKLKLLCGPGRPHSNEDTLLCGPGRPHIKEYRKEGVKEDKKEGTSTSTRKPPFKELNAGFACKSGQPSTAVAPSTSEDLAALFESQFNGCPALRSIPSPMIQCPSPMLQGPSSVQSAPEGKENTSTGSDPSRGLMTCPVPLYGK
jgi:hypothetical protein